MLTASDPLDCRLLFRSTSPHLQQLYTGFLLLHRSGAVRLSQRLRREPWDYASSAPHLKEAGHAHLDALVDGSVRVHFDTHDSLEIALGELERCDYYFKRSFLPSYVQTLPAQQRHKVFPLGLNYRVLPDVVDLFAMQRSLALTGLSRATISEFKRALDVGNLFGYQPRLRQMHAAQDLDAEPKVLFLVAAYDPYDDPDRSPEKIDDRNSVNETRARCLRLLRRELGSRFIGGFASNPFSRERYADLVVPADVTAQQNYLRTLRSAPICIATTGLHGSTGWKFAEYVAFSKAILTETMVYGVPAPFERGRHYLEFGAPEECVEKALLLLDDTDLRRTLMSNNATYYESHLRPDRLVGNVLEAVRKRDLRPLFA